MDTWLTSMDTNQNSKDIWLTSTHTKITSTYKIVGLAMPICLILNKGNHDICGSHEYSCDVLGYLPNIYGYL